MDAPGVSSGKVAGDTILKGLAEYPLPSERETNVLDQYTTEKQPTKGAGGEAKF
jgi:hypothetical protein